MTSAGKSSRSFACTAGAVAARFFDSVGALAVRFRVITADCKHINIARGCGSF